MSNLSSKFLPLFHEKLCYRLGTVNSNTVISKFHLIRIFYEVSVNFFLSFHI